MPDSLELKKNCNFAILNKYMQIYRKTLILMVLCLVCGLASQASREELYENFCCFSAVQEHFSSDSFKKPKKNSPYRSSKSNNKKVTFETFEQNYERACYYYEKQSFLTAARIFEELYPLSLGTPRADTILFLFADCYYQNRDYEMAAFHFKEYANRYTASPRAEEAYFNAIRSISMLSPDYSLDQTETYYVIEEIENFVRLYPNSRFMPNCNKLLDEMRDKLAKKSYEILKLYYVTENYASVQVLARNFFKEYAYSQYADDAYLILVKNNFEYAQHSVEKRKVERYNACVEAFKTMEINHPYSSLLVEARKVADEAQIRLTKKENISNKKLKNNEDRLKKE